MVEITEVVSSTPDLPTQDQANEFLNKETNILEKGFTFSFITVVLITTFQFLVNVIWTFPSFHAH